MGIPSIPRMCSHLQNAARANLTLTSVPNTKYNLRLLLAMHRLGYISTITRGGPKPPDETTISTEVPEPTTYLNVATRRLWVGLKYLEGRPVMRNIENITTSKRWVTASAKDLQRLARGRDANNVRGLELGEGLFLSTDIGVLESREAIEKMRGGLLLCRVS